MTKILLVNDFSNYHVYLKDGLENLGYDVDLYSSGDHLKQTYRTINRVAKPRFLDLKDCLRTVRLIRKYDVVQFVSSHSLRKNILLWLWLLFFGKKYKKKLFMCSVGSDYVFYKYSKSVLNLPLVDQIRKYDKQNSFKWFVEIFVSRLACKLMTSRVSKVIATNEYFECYKKLLEEVVPIQLPINSKKYIFKEHDFTQKLNIVHGYFDGRRGFKGTPHIEQAFIELNEKHPDKLHCKVIGNLSFKEYQKEIDAAHVIVDQTNVISFGVNALGSMAMGKIVCCGSQENVWLEKWFQLQEIDEFPPIFPIFPDKAQIVVQIERLLEDRENLFQYAANGRRYVERFHSAKFIAQKFLNVWGV